MKRTCQYCNKKFVFNKKQRKEDIGLGQLPEGTEGFCDSCIKDIASIEADRAAAFWEQSFPIQSD